jgi:hypothetical protein
VLTHKYIIVHKTIFRGFKMMIKKFTRALLPSVIALTLAGCGVDGAPTPIVTGPPVEPTPAPVAVGQQVTLETPIEHITIDGVTQYYIDLEQDAETLVISFAKGVVGESLGDTDMYVKFEDESATLDNYTCASLRSPDRLPLVSARICSRIRRPIQQSRRIHCRNGLVVRRHGRICQLQQPLRSLRN